METKALATSKRKVVDHLETSLPKPYMARALVAPDKHHSIKTTGNEENDLSALQQHVSFFDKDNDRIVYPKETYSGLREIGLNPIFSFLATIFFHLAFSYRTRNGWLPSPFLPIYVNNIQKAKHGSDTGIYDSEGRFMPMCLESMFSKYSQKAPGKLTLRELWNMTEDNRASFDIYGRILAKLEWGLVYYVAHEHGFLTKETVTALYDGSLFESLAEKHSNVDAKMG